MFDLDDDQSSYVLHATAPLNYEVYAKLQVYHIYF